MLEKFINIKNIGRFRDCVPRGDVTFRKLTLLFAENGRGKTTLCAILRSLQTGQPEFILERKTLGTNDSSAVEIRLGGNNVAFRTNAWSASHPDIAIFDSVFVHDNVYAGDYVGHEHKKNLYRVIVGAQGVQYAKEVDELDDKIRDANTDIKTKKAAVLKRFPKGTTFDSDSYLDWQPVEDIETKIQQKNAEMTNRRRIMEKQKEIQSKNLLAKIVLPMLPPDFLLLLAKQLTDITSDAEARVRQQITAHSMGLQGETWLSQGLNFVANDECPFCGQVINGNQLIAAYRSYFNAAYKELKQEVTQLTKHIADSIGESSLITVQRTLLNNLTLIEFWKQFAEISLPQFAFDDAREKYAMLRECASGLARKKQQSPIEPISPDAEFQAALDAVTALKHTVQVYNAAVETCNILINEQKSATQQDVDINAIMKELDDLNAKKERFEPETVQACQEYQKALAEKAGLEKQKKIAKQQLDRYCEQVLQNYQQLINTYLDQFNAGFKITNSGYSYTGGTPSSRYQIEINNNVVDLGNPRTQPGTPCFKTTLSSGDRSALALAFFLASMKQDSGIANKIVVLDDPFTSQDRFRRTCTQQLIRQLADTAKQVIVLSHDPHFLRLISEGYPSPNIKVLQMCRVGDNTVIGEWDIEAETRSTYLKNYSALLDYYRERKGTALDVARSMSPAMRKSA